MSDTPTRPDVEGIAATATATERVAPFSFLLAADDALALCRYILHLESRLLPTEPNAPTKVADTFDTADRCFSCDVRSFLNERPNLGNGRHSPYRKEGAWAWLTGKLGGPG